MKIPYTQQFSPEQTKLEKLLPILRAAKDRASLAQAIGTAFFSVSPDPEKQAKNTLIALAHHGYWSDEALTPSGKELVGFVHNIPAAKKLIAKNILLNLNGIPLVETLRDMGTASMPINLRTLPIELRRRGFEVSSNSSDLSGVFGWLREAGVLTGLYGVNDEVYQEILGTSVQSLEALFGLKPEQAFFVRSMIALCLTDWTPYSVILTHAEAIFIGEIQFNWKDVVKNILTPLQKAGLIQVRKKVKGGNSSEGRGGKTAERVF